METYSSLLTGPDKSLPVIFCLIDKVKDSLPDTDSWLIRHLHLWKCHPWFRFFSLREDQDRGTPNWGLQEIPNQDHIDILVTSEEERNFDGRPPKLTLQELNLFLRSIIRTSGFINTQEGYRSDLTHYYNESINTEFIDFRVFWGGCVMAESNSYPWSPRGEQFQSLYKRIGTLLRSADYVGIFSTVEGNNTVSDELIYHFGYLILVAYGIIEDFAWIIYYHLNLNLSRTRVGLRNIPAHQDFLKATEDELPEIHSMLMEHENQEYMNFVFTLRSIIVHRNYLSPYIKGSIGGHDNRAFAKLTLHSDDYQHLFLQNSAHSLVRGLSRRDQDSIEIDPFEFTANFLFTMSQMIGRFSRVYRTTMFP